MAYDIRFRSPGDLRWKNTPEINWVGNFIKNFLIDNYHIFTLTGLSDFYKLFNSGSLSDNYFIYHALSVEDAFTLFNAITTFDAYHIFTLEALLSDMWKIVGDFEVDYLTSNIAYTFPLINEAFENMVENKASEVKLLHEANARY